MIFLDHLVVFELLKSSYLKLVEDFNKNPLKPVQKRKKQARLSRLLLSWFEQFDGFYCKMLYTLSSIDLTPLHKKKQPNKLNSSPT